MLQRRQSKLKDKEVDKGTDDKKPTGDETQGMRGDDRQGRGDADDRHGRRDGEDKMKQNKLEPRVYKPGK